MLIDPPAVGGALDSGPSSVYAAYLRCLPTLPRSSDWTSNRVAWRARSPPASTREGPHLAASRSTAPAPSTLAPRRISFARINEPLEVPDLLSLQTSSFKWLIGSPE